MEKIQAALVLEMLGKPADHLKEAMQTLVTKMGAESGVKIIKKEYHDPINAEGSKTLFTTFAEVELELESTSNLLGIIFAYMPSNVEVINPQKFTLTSADLNELSNALVQRLHKYDAITKKVLGDRNVLIEKLKEATSDKLKKSEKEDGR